MQPYKIEKLNTLFADAGFFAYDPILFFLRSEQVEINDKLSILSIGSGLIKNISNELSLGENFDIIYDTFLYDQFQATSFFFKTITNKYKLNYLRISEFPNSNQSSFTVDQIIAFSQNRLASLKKSSFDFLFQ